MKCLYPPCTKEPKSRGLCANHLVVARKLVASKKLSWANLEAIGKALKPKPKIGPVEAWFMSTIPNAISTNSNLETEKGSDESN